MEDAKIGAAFRAVRVRTGQSQESVAHAALQGSVLRTFERRSDWTAIPEVSYANYGERGAIDILAWHAATRSLLVIELKTLLVDPGELVRSMNQRKRLAPQIGGERGWRPATVSTWLLLTDTRTNRRHVTIHARVLASLSVIDGRRMRRWLRRPAGAASALSFWAEPDAVIPRRVGARGHCSATRVTVSSAANLDSVDPPD